MINYESEYNKKSSGEKILNVCKTIYNSAIFGLNIIPNLFYTDKYVISPNPNNPNMAYEPIEFKTNSKGLIVAIHGLLGSPRSFGYEIGKKISKYNLDDIDYISPIVPYRGNCALEISSKPIYDLILQWIKINPSKPIHIISCSNGCRIASFIETNLRNLDLDIKLTCVVGAFDGSINIDNFGNLLGFILDKNLLDEMKTNSAVNNKLKEKINSEIEIGTRHYEFYGTANDSYIPNFNGCFPIIEEKKNLTVIYHDLKIGYGHVSLPWYLLDEILISSYTWFKL